MAKIRVGIIGAGTIAAAHVRAFQVADQVEIAAIWNRTRTRAEELAATTGLEPRVVRDEWQPMLEQGDVDVVSIVTAPQLRAEPVGMALENGIHVLIEKPMATTPAIGREMLAMSEASHCVCAVCFTWRYKPSNMAARRLIRDGSIGNLRHYSSAWRFSLPSELRNADARPFINEAHGGIGMLGENGSHQFDMFTFLTGESVDQLTGQLEWVANDANTDRVNWSHHLIGGSAGGATASFEHTTPPGPVWSESQRHVHIEGTAGSVRIDGGLLNDGKTWVRIGDEEGGREVDPVTLDVPRKTDHDGLVADFLAAVRDGERSVYLPTFGDGLRSLELVACGLRADKERRWVPTSDVRE